MNDDTFTVLVTGANSGLGFSTCCRLIDEFLHTRPLTHTLHLLFSTRDVKKSEQTKTRLDAHLQRTLAAVGSSHRGPERVRLEGVLVDLLKLSTVKALAEQLLHRGRPLDAVVWNAGIAGWAGINWPKAIFLVLTDLIHATTYPAYTPGIVGMNTKPQLPTTKSTDSVALEPRLGQVFTANVFGHYLLTHWLAPLLRSRPARIVWISSITAIASHFDPADLQGLRSNVAYESSKRLTDILVLTSNLPATRASVDAFLSSPPPPRGGVREQQQDQQQQQQGASSRPEMYVAHPGVIGTSIADLPWILEFCMLAFFYIARWLGSPWHLVSPYKGAVAPAFAVLAPASQLADHELRYGKGKWGSSTGVAGDERVARTVVEGWGFGGKVDEIPPGSVTGTRGRYRALQETTRESREEFEELGRQVWREMEEMRVDWEARLGRPGEEM